MTRLRDERLNGSLTSFTQSQCEFHRLWNSTSCRFQDVRISQVFMPLGISSCVSVAVKDGKSNNSIPCLLLARNFPDPLHGSLFQGCQQVLESIIDLFECNASWVSHAQYRRILEPGHGNPSGHIIQEEWMGSYPCPPFQNTYQSCFLAETSPAGESLCLKQSRRNKTF